MFIMLPLNTVNQFHLLVLQVNLDVNEHVPVQFCALRRF